MNVLLQHLWPALAAAGLLGFGSALVFGAGTGLPSARREVWIAAILAMLAGILASVSEAVPGRPGLWLDIGVLCVLAYAAGVAAGGTLRWLAWTRRRSANGEVA